METGLAFESGHLASPIIVKKEVPFFLLRGNLFTLPGNPFLPVYVKLLPPEQRSIEVVCAWIARELGLPAPKPFFVQVRRSKLPSNRRWPLASDEEICFGTQEIANGQPLTRVDSDLVRNILLKWPQIVPVSVFDQLIANDDRTNQNLLVDGRMRVWIIDHARALGGTTNISMFDDAFPAFKNMLIELLASLQSSQRSQLRPDFLAAVSRTIEVVERIPYSRLGVDASLSTKLDSLLRRRAGALHAMVFADLGLPELFGTGSPSLPANLQ